MSIFEYDKELHERKLGEDRYQKGIAEGEQLATQEIIKNMLSSGYSPEFITEATGKPLELILKIQNEHN